MNAISGIHRARSLLRPKPASGGLFDLSRLSGRVTEIAEAGYFGALSALSGLLLQVQERKEQIAWIAGNTVFFPPDLAFRGLDVEALTVVRVPEPASGLQAADTLIRSGAFGLVVLDWTGDGVDEAVLGRLARLAERCATAVLFLTRKPVGAPSVATQVSLRGQVSQAGGETQWLVTKDKRSGPASRERTSFHGPFGLY